MSVKTLSIDYSQIEIGNIEESSFNSMLSERYGKSRKVILVDENTHDFCLEYLITTFPALEEAEVMLLPVGEENKVMEVCFQVWQALTEYGIVRSDLIINLGGGVVTDMGGFIAAVFKRGLDFIHIPTTLLGMVDAAIGGKTGIDLGNVKNQLGVFQHPQAVYVDPRFLATLPEDEFVSGYAEMIKHALISDSKQWELLNQIDPSKLLESNYFSELIGLSIAVKVEVVNEDPKEKNRRKSLNFGHTIGHALESFFLAAEEPIKHGHAVGLGMIAETFLSFKAELITQRELLEITNYLSQLYNPILLTEAEKKEVIAYLKMDKKNDQEGTKCVYLLGIGASKWDILISDAQAHEALLFLESVFQSN